MLKWIGEHLRSELLNVKYVVILFLDLSTSTTFQLLPPPQRCVTVTPALAAWLQLASVQKQTTVTISVLCDAGFVSY